MKKSARVVSIFMAVIMALSIFAMSALAATKGTVKTKTAGSSVALRKTASTSAAKVTTVKDGTSIDVISKTKDGKWYKVKAGTKEGYLLKDYVKLSSSSSSSSASTTSTTTPTATAKKAAYFYTKASTKSTKVGTLKKGETVTVTSETTSYYKIKTSKNKVGYVVKTNMNLNSAVKQKDSPGTATGVYTTSVISKPADVVNSQMGFWNAINYNLINFVPSFTIKVKGYKPEWMPTQMSKLEYAYVDGNIDIKEGAVDGDTTSFVFNVNYNEAGRVIQSIKNGTALAATDTRAIALKAEVDKALATVEGKSDYQKIVGLHDYVVLNTAYDSAMSPESYSAYGTLINKKASCQGYMETFGLLATAAGIENRCVWANSKMGDRTGTHGFNKVKLAGKWYNVDCTVDDQVDGSGKDVPGRALKAYLLVTDTVSKQRYSWDAKRYPAATTESNWHQRNKLTATNQAGLEAIVKKGAANKEKYISVWVKNYKAGAYSPSFASKLPGVKSAKMTITGAATEYKTFQTCILFTMTY